MSINVVVGLAKGGTAKTTTSVNLTAAIAKKGKKALLMDLDSQGNCANLVGLDPEFLEKHLSQVLLHKDSMKLEDIIITTDYGFDLIASNSTLREAEKAQDIRKPRIISELIKPLQDKYDFIIFDTPSEMRFLALSSYLASNYAILSMQALDLAVKAVVTTINDIKTIMEDYRGDIELLGILPTMYRNQIAENEAMQEAMEAFDGLIFPFYTSNLKQYKMSAKKGVPLVEFEPDGEGAQVYTQLAELVIKRSKNGKK